MIEQLIEQLGAAYDKANESLTPFQRLQIARIAGLIVELIGNTSQSTIHGLLPSEFHDLMNQRKLHCVKSIKDRTGLTNLEAKALCDRFLNIAGKND